jgi:aryl-alcohol dehydrogenase-like predicted oxidoreductase
MQHDKDQLDYLKTQSQDKPLSRRDFVRAITIASAAGPGLITAALSGISLTSSQRADAARAVVDGLGKLPKVKLGAHLGGMMVTPVCMSQDWNRELFGPAVEMGINFIHKAGYWGSKESIPEEIRNLPRESYFTDITVDNTSPGHNPDNYDEAYNQVKNSLANNGLKYYDIYRAHYGWHSPEKVVAANNTSYKAFLKLKSEGLVKYFGVSQHPYTGTEREDAWDKYPVMIQALIDSGIITSIQTWYSYKYPEVTREIYAKASKAGIGMTAMKIYAHGNGQMRNDPTRMAELKANDKVGTALLRQVLTEKRPDGKAIFQTCVSNLQSLQVFEENVAGVSPKIAALDGFDGFDYAV